MHYYKRHLGDYARDTGQPGKRWVEVVFLEAWGKLPNIPCCYAIYFDGNLKYIGSTNNLRNRFSGHAFRYGFAKKLTTPWGVFDLPADIKLKYSPSQKYGDWLMREARLIRKLQPEFNAKLKGRRKP
jgi:excinuclease UvrABC nuclease subunit